MTPSISVLVRRVAEENPLWGAPKIHGELQKLGVKVGERTVSRLLARLRRGKPDGSQRWTTFLRNHASGLASVDLFTVPTVTFRVLYVMVILSHERRQVVHFNVTELPDDLWRT